MLSNVKCVLSLPYFPHTYALCLVNHSLGEVLGEDEVGRRARQRGDAANVRGVGNADAHGFTNHQVAMTLAGSRRLTYNNLQDNTMGESQQ